MDSNQLNPKVTDLQSAATLQLRRTPKYKMLKIKKMIAQPRIELGTGAYETPVLPLHYRAVYVLIIHQLRGQSRYILKSGS